MTPKIPLEAKDTVKQAIIGFSTGLFASDYAQIPSNEEQLKNLTRLCDLKDNQQYLDIGTGNGYVAFELSRMNPESIVIGIDVVDKAIHQNNLISAARSNHNINFITFDGLSLPFSAGTFHTTITRYAFHHFPLPLSMITEMYRVLEPDGFVVLCDPIANVTDSVDFADSFAKLKADGHVKYYMEDELINFFEKCQFQVESQFYNYITFPRDLNNDCITLLDRTPRHILDEYQINLIDNKIYIILSILNVWFKMAK